MLKIKNVSKSYNSKIVLENISLTIENNQTYALLGRNGVGKSTLINMIVDLIPVSSGNIFINGKENNQLTTEDKRQIGVVGDNLGLIEEINGREYLEFVGAIYKIPKQTLNDRIQDLFSYFFEDAVDLKKNIAHYSTGMKKKIAFCAAVIHTPPLLILDEPFSGLDPIIANQMIAFIKAYQQKDRIILISSHDLSYLEKVATNVGILNECKLQLNSSISDFTAYGINSLDEALLNVIKPSSDDVSQINWI